MRTTDDWLFFRVCGLIWTLPVSNCIITTVIWGVPFVKEQKMEHAEDDDSAPRFIRLIFEHDPLVRYDWQN